MLIYPFNRNKLTEERVEQIRMYIEDNYQVSNTKLIKQTSHSLVFEGMRNGTLEGFVYQKEIGAVIQVEDYEMF
jgi:hypothetical protein